MPTILRTGPYRFYFYSHEPDEPAHVHVDRDDCSAKFWLKPVGVTWNSGFAAHEIRRIERIVREERPMMVEAWNEHLE